LASASRWKKSERKRFWETELGMPINVEAASGSLGA
jgi:hypothetical protein